MKRKGLCALLRGDASLQRRGRAFFVLAIVLFLLTLLTLGCAVLAPLAKTLVISLAAAALIFIVIFTLTVALFIEDGVASRLMTFIESASENSLDLQITHICLRILPFVCAIGLLVSLAAIFVERKEISRCARVRRVLLIVAAAVMLLSLVLSLLWIFL